MTGKLSLTVGEAAKELAVSQSTIRSYIYTGQLPAQKFGHVWEIPKSACETFTYPRMGRPPLGRVKRRR